MERINVAWMYPNLLNLHGERGSVQMLVEVGKQLGVDVRVTRIEDFDESVRRLSRPEWRKVHENDDFLLGRGFLELFRGI